MQPITGEVLSVASTNNQGCAHLDVATSGFCGLRREDLLRCEFLTPMTLKQEHNNAGMLQETREYQEKSNMKKGSEK